MNARRALALGLGSLLLSASAAVSSAAWADDPTPAPSATAVEAVSCDATTPEADGSWSQKCSDGSSYVYNADGSWVNTLAGGCVISGDAEGNTKREGDCPEEAPTGIGGGCFQQTDADGAPVLDDAGNPLVACADGVACSADGPEVACPMMYSMGAPGSDLPGRENCPQCRNLANDLVAVSAGAANEPAAINSDRLGHDAAAVESALTAADKAAAIEAAGSNQPAVALPGTGQSKGAGPVAPIAATVLGGGMLAAGVSIWRGRVKVPGQ
ncbi:MAG: hypothetical protein KGP01_05195 [Actinomycetales bacterium]|nr:hypothetical protein [Actinomycetales bacterium]